MRLFGIEIDFVDKPERQTNRDALADMDSSELALFIVNHSCPPGLLFTKECTNKDCVDCWTKWLNADREKVVRR